MIAGEGEDEGENKRGINNDAPKEEVLSAESAEKTEQDSKIQHDSNQCFQNIITSAPAIHIRKVQLDGTCEHEDRSHW